jgi:uncharacterized protein
MNALTKYFNLRDQIDKKVAELSTIHASQMACKKGCDACCFSFKVFPVEFYAIKSSTGLKGDFNPNDLINGNERCLFLIDHTCVIYENRPIICRTHGLPLLNMNDDGTDWELSACELNFTDVDENYLNEENVFIQDTYNSKLFQINKLFVQSNDNLGFDEFHLIPLKSLISKEDL